MIKEVRDTFLEALSEAQLFKTMTVGFIPPPSQIKKFPALAVDMVQTDLERRSGCSFWANSTIDLYVYNRTSNRQTTAKDILDLVQEVDRALQIHEALNEMVTDVYVSSIVSDGGVSTPIEVYRVSVELTYLTNNNYNK